MKLHDATLLDPADGITAEDIEKAYDGVPAPYVRPADDLQDDIDEQFDSIARGLTGVVPATPAQARANAKALTDNHVFVGVGMCLRTVRGPIFGLPSLWPTAAIAWRHGAPYHPFDDVTKIPGGLWISWVNIDLDDPGHTALSLGGGLCRTTDYHENGFVGIALIAKLESWCGDPFKGPAEKLNGFDVYPNSKPQPKPPEHEFHSWEWQRKVEFLRNEANRDRKDHPRQARHLDDWAAKIHARHADERK
jgi:hypothetical protein